MKKSNFITDVMLFRNRSFNWLGVLTWCVLTLLLFVTIGTLFLIYQLIQMQP